MTNWGGKIPYPLSAELGHIHLILAEDGMSVGPERVLLG